MTHAFRYGRKVAALVAGISWLVLAAPAGVRAAATIQVPTDFPTIQAAINAAADGDTIVVSPGTYFEHIDFLGKAITVESAQGPASTIVDGSSSGTVVTFTHGEGLASVLQGFTIQHGVAQTNGGGIHIGTATPTIENNVVTDNFSDVGGGGIADNFGSPLIANNVITGNSANSFGGGIDLQGAGNARVIGNLILSNTAGDGAGISGFAAGNPTIENNVIENNEALEFGGGIWLVNQSDANIVQNLVTGNSALNGAGVYVLTPASTRGPWLTNNSITDNAASGSGSAVYASGYFGETEYFNNIATAPSGQTALGCDFTYSSVQPLFDHNDFFGATGSAVSGCSGVIGSNGNISTDPLFIGATDFRLQPTSLAIDAGNDNAPNLPSTDLAGNPRIVGAAVDIGAYEAPIPAPGPVQDLGVVWAPQQSAIVSWTAPAQGPVTSYTVTESSDGTTATVDAGTRTVTFSGLRRDNTYTFTVVATNSAGNGPPTSVMLIPS